MVRYKCNKCATWNYKDAKFCRNCGSKLDFQNSNINTAKKDYTSGAGFSQKNNIPSSTAGGKSSDWWSFLLLGAIIALLAAFLN